MRSLLTNSLCVCLLWVAVGSSATAQSDAEIALGKARLAFDAKNFSQARDLLVTASQTDGRNPDIFLLLGRAHYQLGDVAEAIDAWNQTLKLAPNQAYARSMVEKLQGRVDDFDTQLAVVASLIRQRVFDQANSEITKLSRAVLTPSQRDKLLITHAELFVEMGLGNQALANLEKMLARQPDQRDTPQVLLIQARSLLLMDDDAVNRGLAILSELKTAETAEGHSAELALLIFQIRQGTNSVAELSDWMANHSEHRDLPVARLAMVEAVSLFVHSAQGQPAPDPEDDLTEFDIAAIDAASHALANIKTANQALQIVHHVSQMIEGRWIGHKAFKGADAAIARLSQWNVPQSSRDAIQRLAEKSTSAAASSELSETINRYGNGDLVAESLTEWLEKHGDHSRSLEARRILAAALLQESMLQMPPGTPTELAPSDVAAIGVLGEMIVSDETDANIGTTLQMILQHLENHYVSRSAPAPAITGYTHLLSLDLPRPTQLKLQLSLVDSQIELAFMGLDGALARGTFEPGPMPESFKQVLETLSKTRDAHPAQPAWNKQAAVATRLNSMSDRLPWPATIEQLKSTDNWAIEIALPLITANEQPDETQKMVALMEKIIQPLAGTQQASAIELAASTHRRLLSAIEADHKLWPQVVLRQISLRDQVDQFVFAKNQQLGKNATNATLGDLEKGMLSLGSDLITKQPSHAAGVVTALQPMIQRRLSAGHEEASEEAYATLEQGLPPIQLREVQLAVANSWINRATTTHAKMLSDGFQPPKELDPLFQRALERCYQLQAPLRADHEFVVRVQALRSVVVAHYRNLGNFEAARAAIKIKGEPAVSWIDAQQEYELAGLNLSIALDDLAKQTQKFQGRENIAMTPAINEAIAGFQSFVTERPNDPLVPRAIGRLMNVGKAFEQYEKYDIAATHYRKLETFAAGIESLAQAPAGSLTVAQRVAHSAAAALHVKATKALDGREKSPDGSPLPPTELSPEFIAAITAYNDLLTKYPESTLVSTSIGKLMEIALQHANADAWDVAAKVYADLQALQLPLRQPERIDLAQALCEMGKVIPDHARQMLAAITLWERDAAKHDDMTSMLAVNGHPGQKRPQPGFGGGGGFGGFGSDGAVNEEEFMLEAKEMSDMLAKPAGSIAAAEMPQSESAMGAMAMGLGTAGMTVKRELDAVARFGDERAAREKNLLATVRQRQSAMASQIAMLRDSEIQNNAPAQSRGQQQESGQQAAQQGQIALPTPVLSENEIKRRRTILEVAYQKLQAIRETYADSNTAGEARAQIMVIVNHWRSIRRWEDSAKLVKRFLDDNPDDIGLPKLRHEIARDYLAWAAGAVKPDTPKQELLDEVNRRYSLAREELSGIIAAFADDQQLKHQAQWDIATSHLSQARVVAGISSTLARGQYVRASTELLATADLYHDHPKINELPQMLWGISQELTARRFFEEAITVWTEMTLHYPGNPLAEQAAMQIATTYESQLRLPLRAVESYLELNFARGGNDTALQDSIFRIASQLMNEKRWVEALHVLETFIDSFPNHASAGQALTKIGQVHQTNEVWEDAIAAYRRVIMEYDQGNWAQQSKWSIAECTINLSRWEEAQGAYLEYKKSYPEDGKVAEATSRIEILKDLARFQKVVDEQGQRKAFDAQYQIAAIVRNKLANPVKAIIEYRKVASNWPESHLADDSLFQVGMIYMQLGQTENARDAFLATAQRYPTSPLADDALFQVGASFENEAQQLVGVTRGRASKIANEVAQRQAYAVSQENRKFRREQNQGQIQQLRKAGKADEADNKAAFQAALNVAFDQANAAVFANWAAQQEEALTTAQLADRQDKINAALRKAVDSFRKAASVASADKADDALLRMAQIYDQRLKDSEAAMATWLEIVRQYSGTAVAEDASWKIAQYYETHEKYADAISAYNSFLRNYRRSPKASEAQAAIAENHEQLGNWVEAMDAYTNYINNYPEGALAGKAKEQIAWIKTYRL